MKRGQAAIEYLTTFGWVFLLIVIVLAALAYFGFLSPNNFIPERCYFSTQMICEDFRINYVDTSQSTLRFQIRNNFAKNIEVISVAPIDLDVPLSGCSTNVDIGIGQVQEIICTVTTRLFKGDKHSIPLQINFMRNDTGPSHFVSGEVFAKVT